MLAYVLHQWSFELLHDFKYTFEVVKLKYTLIKNQQAGVLIKCEHILFIQNKSAPTLTFYVYCLDVFWAFLSVESILPSTHVNRTPNTQIKELDIYIRYSWGGLQKCVRLKKKTSFKRQCMWFSWNLSQLFKGGDKMKADLINSSDAFYLLM